MALFMLQNIENEFPTQVICEYSKKMGFNKLCKLVYKECKIVFQFPKRYIVLGIKKCHPFPVTFNYSDDLEKN